jgi:hypothetical protein
MKYDEISMYVSDSYLLSYLFNENNSFFKRALFFVVLFFMLPFALIIISYFDNTLIFEGDPVGMFEDYLILTFAFGVAPVLIFLLKFVVKRFMYFVNDIPYFTRLTDQRYSLLRKQVCEMMTETGKRKKMELLKYSVGCVALMTNVSSIINRCDGWNSLSHPGQFVVTLIYLIVMLCVVMPEIFFKYLHIVVVEIKLTRRLAKEDLIVVRPLAPDKCGGLRSLGELSLAFSYFLLPFTLVEVVHYFTWRVLTVGCILGLIAFVPLFVIVFFVPLGVVHKVMAESKMESLHELSEKYLDVSRKIVKDMKEGKNDEELVVNRELIEVLDNMYEKADRMPVWPFNIKTLSRFVSITIGPLGIIFLEALLQSVFQEMLR